MRIHLYSIHGLFRAGNLEIGRDADNGGQIAYVMELAKALSRLPEVTHVHLFTRRIEDPALSADYATAVEPVNEKFDIRRIACGGRRYLPKEQLWRYLDEFVTNAVNHIKTEQVFPDWIHSHYADAGYVASELSAILNVPFAHTGHSLGRPKLQKLLAGGLSAEEAQERFRFEERFAAEDATLLNSEFVVTSTAQEVISYDVYESSAHAEFHVIPPGLNFERYYPYYDDAKAEAPEMVELRKQARFTVKQSLEKFFSHPDKPVILAICRPDKKKNIDGLIHAFGTDKELQAMANLAIFAGLRSDINTMPLGEKEVLTEILLLMDKYNLYGRLAIPKKHDVEWEVPEIYRFCASKNGVFINVALNEPFGLTILEATACGLPVVATQDGGPSEILAVCESGLLVPPTDTPAIQKAARTILADPELWQKMSLTGVRRVREHYSWDHHVKVYLELVQASRQTPMAAGRKDVTPNPKLTERMKKADRMIICDIDDTIIAPREGNPGLEEFKQFVQDRGNRFVFGVASGRSLSLIRQVIAEYDIPVPDVTISSVGTFISYGLEEKKTGVDKGWHGHIDNQWNPEVIRERLEHLPGIEPQEPDKQNEFKISYYISDPALSIEVVKEALGRAAAGANIIMTQSAYLDILPRRASKGRAIRYVANKWSIPLHQTVVCGDSGNDLDMFNGQSRGIVVANHAPEVEVLRGRRRVFFAEAPAAAGILEGLRYHQFLETVP